MSHVSLRVYAFLPIALALFSAACGEETRLVPTAAVAEAATLVAKRTTALRGNLDITDISIETRYWNPASGLPTESTAAATYDGLAMGTAGYTYPAVGIPNVGTAPSVLITPDGVARATSVRHPGSAYTNIATRISITIDAKSPSSIGIRFGVDARGAVVLLDGTPVASDFNNPWWGGYYLADISDTDTPVFVTNPWGVLEVLPLDLPKGVHTIEVIGFEDGNDFGTGGQIDLGAGYQDIIGPIPQQNLTVSTFGGGVGSVASSPAGISCGADCAEPYDFGTTVTLTAAATPPSVFAGWGGACSGVSTACMLTMNADRAVTAKFVTAPTVSAMTMETRYWWRSGPQPTEATAMSLFASLPTGSVGYTNAPVPVATLVRNGALFTAPNVGADHDLATYTVITLSTVNPSVLQLHAAVDYQAGGGVWLDGTKVTGVFGSPIGTLMATLNLNAGAHTIELLGFEDCCDGAPRLEFNYGTGWFSLTAPLPPPQTLTVTAGAAGGRVISQPAGIDCGTACVADFATGSQVTLTVAVNAGYSFTGWSGGGCSGTGTCVVRMNSAQYVTANFRQTTLTVVRDGTGSGTVTSAPSGISCGENCTASFAEGSSVTLTATPTIGSDFTGWSGADCSGTGTCTVSMTQAQAVTATFTRAADSVPPVISCKATPNVLWPVNHKLVDITVQVSLSDASAASFTLVSVLSNEPTNKFGDGSTSADILNWAAGTADVAGQLRAERAGNLKDRIYTLTYRGTDASGNTADATCTVTVPHDKR